MRRSRLLGHTVIDWHGEELGRVIDTWPFDGGGEPELAVLRMGRLGERRMVPVAHLHPHPLGETLHMPYARWQVEDSPPFGEDRHRLDDDPHCSASYWRWEEPMGSLPARCPHSCGSSVTGKRSPTTPSPTTTAS
jgi:hypothetical protein